MIIKHIFINATNRKSDIDPNTIKVRCSTWGQWNNLLTKQHVADKFNEYGVEVAPHVEFGLVSVDNYYLEKVNNAHHLIIPLGDTRPLDVDFSLMQIFDNGDERTMHLNIYYSVPNVYLDQVTKPQTVDYTLQMTCDIAMAENRGLTLPIDRYLYQDSQECLSSLWRHGVPHIVNNDVESTPQQRLITKLFNKL